MAEVSYYSYEYDPDTEPFLADAEGGDHFDLPEGGEGVEQKLLLPADTQLPTLDTRNSPERWYELFVFLIVKTFHKKTKTNVCLLTSSGALSLKLICFS